MFVPDKCKLRGACTSADSVLESVSKIDDHYRQYFQFLRTWERNEWNLKNDAILWHSRLWKCTAPCGTVWVLCAFLPINIVLKKRKKKSCCSLFPQQAGAQFDDARESTKLSGGAEPNFLKRLFNDPKTWRWLYESYNAKTAHLIHSNTSKVQSINESKHPRNSSLPRGLNLIKINILDVWNSPLAP